MQSSAPVMNPVSILGASTPAPLFPIALEPVEGDLLPPLDSSVFIHLARQDEWVQHTVVGYYVWGDLNGDPSLQRVFVRVVDSKGFDNARLLRDVRVMKDGKLTELVRNDREFIPVHQAIKDFTLTDCIPTSQCYDMRLHDGTVLANVFKTAKGLSWACPGVPTERKFIMVDLSLVQSVRLHRPSTKNSSL